MRSLVSLFLYWVFNKLLKSQNCQYLPQYKGHTEFKSKKTLMKQSGKKVFTMDNNELQLC